MHTCVHQIDNVQDVINASGLINYETKTLPPSIIKSQLQTRSNVIRPIHLATPKPQSSSPEPKIEPVVPLHPSPAPDLALEVAQLKEAHSEIQELKDMVQKQDLILLWYISRGPGPGPSTIYNLYKDSRSYSQPINTIINAYDHRLAEMENSSRVEGEKYQSSLHQLQTDHKIALSTISNQTKTDTDKLSAHLLSAQETITQQAQTVDRLTDGIKSLETRLVSTTDKLEQSVKSNKLLMSKVGELDSLYIKSELHLADAIRERDRAQRWVQAYKGSVEDYESCVRESGLALILHSDLIHDVAPGSLLLTKHVKNMVRDLQDMGRKMSSYEHEYEKEKKDHSGNLQKYMIDLERKKAELTSAKDHLQESISTADRIKSERNYMSEQLFKLNQKLATSEENLQKLQRIKDDEMVDFQIKAKDQLRISREQYDTERVGLQAQVDMLQKSKIDLQLEIGRLSRERRSTAIELKSVHRNIALSRDQFRRDLGLF
ncbi:hypothetical protein BASA61_007753 [Batrachochytrium salamandrivorans]|nr:hypothetical protein BASA61_007753 [Batrachochytrium salamandrivorans]